MKIGVLTYFIGQNYGAVLQAYATMIALKKMGHEVEFIHYHHPWSTAPSFSKPQSYFSKSIQGTIAKCRRMVRHYQLRKHFRKMEALFPKTEKYYGSNLELLINEPPKCDVYLVGSDQVWNCALGFEFNEAYFLPFGASNVRKVSYASSLGGYEYPAEMRDKVKNYLASFDALSVREQSSAEYLESMGLENIRCVPDPTLLLTKDDYEDLLGASDLTAHDCFVYLLHQDDPQSRSNVEDCLSTCQSALNVPVHGQEFLNAENKIVDVPGFLHSISQAQKVITNSFHCVVFSVLFHRPFVAILLKGQQERMNNRILEFLGQLDMADRVVSTGSQGDYRQQLEQPVNWPAVDQKLSAIRQRGWTYLEQVL